MVKVADLKRGQRGKPMSKGKDSDGSDEDYVVEEDEENLWSNDDEEGKYSSDSFYNKEIFQYSGEEEEASKTSRSKCKRSDLGRKKLGTRGSNNRRNSERRHAEVDDEDPAKQFEVAQEEEEMNRFTISKRKRSCLDQKKWRTKASSYRRNAHLENDDADFDDEEEEDGDENQTEKFEGLEDEEVAVITRSNLNMSCLEQKNLHTQASSNRRNRHGEIDDEDYNFDEEGEDDEDEEFTLDESVSLEDEEYEDEDEDEELVLKKPKRNNIVIGRTSRKKLSGPRKKNKMNVKVSRKVAMKRKRGSSLRRRIGSEDDEDCDDCEDEDFTDSNLVRRRNTKKKPRRRTRKFDVQSDSDFVDSGPSEAEFTISEEEREQVREASKICRISPVYKRNLFSNKGQENESFAQRRKPFVTKGKEKVQEVKNEVIKQACGICFSEEGKNTVRGTLNCCNHYFCFTCILEWSKVESRCPLCKQRFLTISKPAKANTGIDLRDVVQQIPERDQVYQPTEEEIRGYLDPYENVICTECHEGGDDELMLLCDLCDSPAHTYCVGLGREVPEGNWYCEGCRPVSFGSSISQLQGSISVQRNLFHRLPSFEGVRDEFNGSLSIPSTTFSQGFGSFPSPRYIGGGIQAPSPRSGTGVVTVSGRRQIHRHIQSMFSNHRTRLAAEALYGISANNSQVNQSHRTERTSTPSRTPGIGTSLHSQLDEVSCNMTTPQNMQSLPVSSDNLGGLLFPDTTAVPGDHYVQGTFSSSNIYTLRSNQPIHLTSRSSVGHAFHLSTSTMGEGSNFYLEEQVKSLVQNFLTSLSSTLTILDASTLEEIGRKSTHTILAACGHHHHHHHPTEVFPMPPQPICTHIEDLLMHPSPIKGYCISCFNNFTKEVVKTIMNSKLPHFLHVRN